MPARASYQTYKVVSGDTLAKIAARFGSTVPAIAVASGIANPDKITVGQDLLIPKAAEPATRPAAPVNPGQAIVIPKAGAAEQAMIAGAINIGEWLKPPKLWVTLAVGFGVGYYLLSGGTGSRRKGRR